MLMTIDAKTQFLIVVERELMRETSNIVSALFNLVAVHYVFSLDYNAKAKDLFRYLQEKVLALKPTDTWKKSITIPSLAECTRTEWLQLPHCETIWLCDFPSHMHTCTCARQPQAAVQLPHLLIMQIRSMTAIT